MPYQSNQQRKFFNANRASLEKQGVNVDEWNKASKGKKLPSKVKPRRLFQKEEDESKETPEHEMSEMPDEEMMEEEMEAPSPKSRKKAFRPRRLFQK